MPKTNKKPKTYAEEVFFGENRNNPAALQVLVESVDPHSLKDIPWADIKTRNPAWPDRDDDIELGPQATAAIKAIYDYLAIDDRMPATWAELKGLLCVLDILQMSTFMPFAEAYPGANAESLEGTLKLMNTDQWWPELVEPCRHLFYKDRKALAQYWADNLSVNTIGTHWYIEDQDKDDTKGRGLFISTARLRKLRETGSYLLDSEKG